MAWLDPFERAGLYVALHAYIAWLAGEADRLPSEALNFFESLGVELPREAPEEVSDYLRRFRASTHRTDLSPIVRTNLENYLKAFYSSAGYSSSEPADSLLTMTAFAARLAIDAYDAHVRGDEETDGLERRLHRFVNTHLLPSLRAVRPPGEEFARAVEELTRLVGEDARTLASKFSRAVDH